MTIDSADRVVATALGMNPHAPQGLTVSLTRLGSTTTPPAMTMTDGGGRFDFTGLLEGTYQLSLERLITEAERQRLPTDDADVTAIATGASVTVVAGRNSVALMAVAGRRGSLVISEIWPHTPAQADRGGWGYPDGVFLEITNNADTIAFLDGVIFGAIPPVTANRSDGGIDFCGEYATDIRLNTGALALANVSRFPGTGRDYPLAPGASVIIAQDAINHLEFAAQTLDLSTAHFESIGDARDVDNPRVPNLIRVANGVGALGRGFAFGSSALPGAYVLGLPTTAFELQSFGPGWGENLHFLPREHVLDFVGLSHSPEARSLLSTFGLTIRDCEPWIAPVYERAPAPIASAETRPRFGYARRVLRTLPDGRVILQRTRTSARDWYISSEPTPGRPR